MLESQSPVSRIPGGWLQRLRVPLGFLFGGIYLVSARPSPAVLPLGLAVAAAGLGLRIWATGYLHKHARLCASGPYRWTRNPLYLGSLLLGLGFCIAAGNPWLALLFGLLFPLIYLPVMKREESELAQAYGRRYLDYREQVPLFFPYRRSRARGGDRFEWGQVIRNREYNAALGFLLVAVFLLWRQSFG